MKRHSLPHGRSLAALVAVMALAVLAPAAEDNSYTAHNLVADTPGTADHTDPQLVNGWGLAASPTSPWWVADNGTDAATLYDGSGNKQSLTVTVEGGPTGEVFNPTSEFVVHSGASSGPARFIWASEDGRIRGWNPGVPPPPPSTMAQVAVDDSASGAIYKGLAIAVTPAGPRLYT